MTRVVGFGAVASFTPSSTYAPSEVAPDLYLRMVLIVQAASLEVSGTPSDHLPPPIRWNVQTRPSALCVQLFAQSPWSFRPGPYCTSWGYSMQNALYAWAS